MNTLDRLRGAEHYVYRLWDKEGRLLYVGCSLDPDRRIQEHRYTSPAFGRDFVTVTLDGPHDYEAARRIEWDAIQTEDPAHNGQSPRNHKARIEQSRLARDVFETAVRNGVPWPEAARQAVIAVDSEASA